MLLAYERYLSGQRSPRQSTVAKYAHIAEAFLDALPDPVGDALPGPWAGQVHGLVLSRGPGAKSIGSGLRSLLRYLYLSGGTPREPAGAVPPPAAASKLACQPARMNAGAVPAIVRSGHGHRAS